MFYNYKYITSGLDFVIAVSRSAQVILSYLFSVQRKRGWSDAL